MSFLQSLLSVLDIWLRGGVSSGETYFDKVILYDWNKTNFIEKEFPLFIN